MCLKEVMTLQFTTRPETEDARHASGRVRLRASAYTHTQEYIKCYSKLK